MNSGTFNALVVGCGNIAGNRSEVVRGTHGSSYFGHPSFDLLGGVDIVASQAEAFATHFQCRAFTDLESALAACQPDVVSICTPDATHFSVTMSVMTSKWRPKVVFLEKPACQNAEEFNELCRIALTNNVLVIVNHTRRFDCRMEALREKIQSGVFGRLVRARGIYYSGWAHNGTHLVDLLNFLLDDNFVPKHVSRAFGSPYPCDPTLEVQGIMSRIGAPVDLVAIDEQFYQIFEQDFWFAKARVRIEDFGARIFIEESFSNEIEENVLAAPKEVEFLGSTIECCPMLNAIESISDFLSGQKPERLDHVTLANAKVTMDALWEARRLYDAN